MSFRNSYSSLLRMCYKCVSVVSAWGGCYCGRNLRAVD
jgi:hypothetical protein